VTLIGIFDELYFGRDCSVKRSSIICLAFHPLIKLTYDQSHKSVNCVVTHELTGGVF